MGCNSNYMRPDQKEVEMSRVFILIDEALGCGLDKKHWGGTHPMVYNRLGAVDQDEAVSRLCNLLQMIDVTKCSLELQMWWRDHQAADKARIETELRIKKNEEEKTKAIQKLTPYERKLLGLAS